MNAKRMIPGVLVALALLIIVAGVILAACGVNPAERNNAGNALYGQGAYDSALDAYQAAQVAAPDEPVPYYNAASALSAVGRVQSAEAALQQALETAGESLIPNAYYNLGNMYFEMAQYQQAVDAYRETLLRQPDDENARYNYELALRRLATPPPPPPQESEQQEEQQSQSKPTPTPTPEPSGDSPPEQTQDPQGEGQSEEGEQSGTPTPQPQGPLSVEQAEQLLDAVQQNQEALSEYRSRTVPQIETPEKDW